MTEPRRLLKLSQASQRVALTAETLRRHIRLGHLNAVRLGARLFIEDAELERYIAAGRTDVTAEGR
jgi:excisionase family DNA binding protein